jgi:hypothetical protein
MPLDADFFRKLSVEERKVLKERLEEALMGTRKQFDAIENKIKTAMMDSKTKPSDWSKFFSYREETKQELNQIQTDLDKITLIYLRDDGGENSNDVAASIGGSGVVNIRPDDTKFKKRAGTKTFQEILDLRKKETYELTKIRQEMKTAEVQDN